MDVESFIRNASEVSLWFSPEGDGDVVNILEVSYLSGSQRKRYCKDACEFKTFTLVHTLSVYRAVCSWLPLKGRTLSWKTY